MGIITALCVERVTAGYEGVFCRFFAYIYTIYCDARDVSNCVCHQGRVSGLALCVCEREREREGEGEREREKEC